MNKELTLEAFCKVQGDLLALERSCEIERAQLLVSAHSSDARELEKRGLALRRLIATESRTGLFGRTIVSYSKDKSAPLPATNISNGDIVGLFSAQEGESIESVPSGVVTQVTSSSLSISFDESIENLGTDNNDTFNIIKLANDVTHKRLKSVLQRVTNESGFSTLHRGLFQQTEFGPPLQDLHPAILDSDKTIKFLNGNLNESQKDAVRFALLQRELAIVHGPPGTGKTTTVVEIIAQEVLQGHKVLCCAPSNVAVDNLLEKLSKAKIRVLRLGHPARLNQDLLKHSLDAVLSQSDQTQLVDDVRKDIDKSLSNLKRARGDGERRRLRNEIKDLRKELREREVKATREILSRADVVLATLTSASEDGPLRNLPKDKNLFDVAVIDECSQALEVACWIALLQTKKAVLAGDHLQLPPTILSTEAANKGLSLTLMERAIRLFGKGVVRMLNTQYRMNEAIMKWSSKSFYDNGLVAHSSVEKRLLKDIRGIESDENTDIPLLLIDTSGCDMFEVESGDEISKANEGEAALVCIHAKQLIKSGMDPTDIAIITPYNLQVELIRLQLSESYPTLEIRSVDGFQGREKEAVILSLVRSNNQGEIGFLSEHRRLNVAVTRAKRHVAVICNVDCISHDPILKSFAEYLASNGEVRTATQYEHLLSTSDIVRPQGMEFVLKDSEKQTSKKKAEGKSKTKKENKIQAKREIDNKKETRQEETDAKIKTENKSRDKEVDLIDRKEELYKMVQTFVVSTDDFYICSPDLTSHDRKIVHEIAEELQLSHESQGERAQRRIVLAKAGTSIPQSLEVQAKGATNSEAENGTKRKPGNKCETASAKTSGPSENKKDVASVVCSGCLKEVPKMNIELHKMRCTSFKQPQVSGVTKKSKSAKKKGQIEEEEEIDKLLESFTKLDTVCNFEKCKTGVSILGVNCQFCKVRYCLGHGLPEAHGCGDAARRAARQQISRDGKLYAGSGRPDMKPDPIRKAQLQRKLDKKLNELEGDRKPKPKKKE